MADTRTPSAILTAAADLIRDAGKKAGSEHDCQRESCGGWHDDRGPCGGCCSCMSHCLYEDPGIVKGGWLDLMRPSAASMLADWLEAERDCLASVADAKEAVPKILNGIRSDVPADSTITVTIDTSGPALAFARHVIEVLGEEVVEDVG